MANVIEPTEEHVRGWTDWVSERPEPVRTVIERHGLTPWKLYLLKSSGHRVTLHSLSEHDGAPVTLKVVVSGQFNLVSFGRVVFGVKPEDLEECDLPKADESVGTVLTDDEVREAIAGVEPGEARHDAIKVKAEEALSRALAGKAEA